jgi:hypothetical protein
MLNPTPHCWWTKSAIKKEKKITPGCHKLRNLKCLAKYVSKFLVSGVFQKNIIFNVPLMIIYAPLIRIKKAI